MMERYKLIVRNYDGIIVQISDPHPWDECEEIFQEYQECYLGTVEIIWSGKD